MVFSGAALPAPYSILEVGPLGPAGGAAERAELECGAPGAVYISTAGLYVLVHIRQRDRAAWERSWSPRSHPADRAVGGKSVCVLYLQDAELGQTNHMASKPTHGPHHPRRSPTPGRA